jgi:hypothetical protein
MTDLRLGLARLAEDALDRAHGGRRAEANRLVEDDPAVERDNQSLRRKIASNSTAAARSPAREFTVRNCAGTKP